MPVWTLPHLTDTSVTLAGYFKSSQIKISQRTLNYPPQKGAVKLPSIPHTSCLSAPLIHTYLFTQGFGGPALTHVLTVAGAKHRTPGWKNLAAPGGVLRPIELEGLRPGEHSLAKTGQKFPGLQDSSEQLYRQTEQAGLFQLRGGGQGCSKVPGNYREKRKDEPVRRFKTQL